MADTATQLPKVKRRVRWPYFLTAAAALAVISIKWLVPIAMEQRAISVIRAECPDVDINIGQMFLTAPMRGLSRSYPSTFIRPVPDRSLILTGVVGPAKVQEVTGHDFCRVLSIQGSADHLRPVANQLRWLRNVENMWLRDATNEDLVYVGQFTNLKNLDLRYCEGITDTGLQHLLSLTKLEDLDLSKTRVTFDGLRQLQACGNLRRLGLGGMPLINAQFEELKRALPDCEVTRY